MCASHPTEAANDDETEEHKGHPAHVDGGASEMREEQPTNDTTDNVASSERDVEVEGLKLTKPCALEEDDRVLEDCVTAENLGGPDDAVLCVTV